MLTLFYAPAACSMAAHIVLEESGEKYEGKRMDLSKGDQKTEAYLKVHPQGRVPALRLDDGIRSPRTPRSSRTLASGSGCGRPSRSPKRVAVAHRLLRRQRASRARAHWPAGAVRARRVRVPDDQGSGPQGFPRLSEQIDGLFAGKQWLFDRYSVLDPYAFVFYVWGVRRELPMAELANYTAFKDRMLARPAVQRVVEDEKVKV